MAKDRRDSLRSGSEPSDQASTDQGFLNEELETLYKKVAEEKLVDVEIDGPVPQDEQGTAFRQTLQDSGSDRPSDSRNGSSIAGWVLIALPLVLIVAFALFIWPTPYEYGDLKQGDKIYQVKTNRFTNAKTFYYNGKWMDAPLADTRKLRLPDPLSIQSPGDTPLKLSERPAPAGENKPPDEKPAPPPTPSKEAAQPVPAKAPVQPPSPPPVSAQLPAQPPSSQPAAAQPPAAQKPSSEPVSRVVQKEPDARVARPSAEPKTKSKELRPGRKAYAIQIQAFQDEKELKTFLKEPGLKKRQDIHWAKVQVNDQVWYRVFLGRFPNDAAARNYLRKKKIDTLYPGSFVQKIM